MDKWMDGWMERERKEWRENGPVDGWMDVRTDKYMYVDEKVEADVDRFVDGQSSRDRDTMHNVQ